MLGVEYFGSALAATSNIRWSNCYMPCRAKASRISQVGLDATPRSVLFSFIGGVSFPGVPVPVVRWLRTEAYTAFSSFTHLLRLPGGVPTLSEADNARPTPAHATIGPRWTQETTHESHRGGTG